MWNAQADGGVGIPTPSRHLSTWRTRFGTLAQLVTCTTMDESEIPKLLAIDEQPHSLRLIKETLFGSGLEILTASSAEEGLETLKRARPRIVLLDLTMTRVRGAELLESILAIDPGTEVILITDEDSAESAVPALLNRDSDHISKHLHTETHT